VLESVELFLKAVDKAIQFLGIREEQRRRVFKEVVEPLYRDVAPVVEDYYLLFAKGISRVKAADANELPSVVAEFTTLREQMFLARERLRQLAASTREHSEDRRLHQFCDRILEVFMCTHLSIGGKAMSKSAEFVELLNRLDELKFRASKGYLVDSLVSSKDHVAQAWLRVNQSYAGLRLASLQ